MKKLVCGVGLCDLKASHTVNGKQIQMKSYTTWKNMIVRCYSESFQERQPTYKDCTVCKEWLTYSNFKAFYDAYYVDGWQLDKDLLIVGNKVYSPETCIFIPRELNLLLTDNESLRGKHPKGVSFNKALNKYHAVCKANGKPRHIGFFSTPEEASKAYQEFKAKHVLQEIARYKTEHSDNNQLMVLLDVLEKRFKDLGSFTGL